MAIQRMDHVGVVVDDLAAATAFFVELGLKLQGVGAVEDGWVDRVVGLEGVRAEVAMVETPDGHGRLELTKFHAPPGRGGDRHAPANTPGIRHVAFAVDDIDAVVASLRARGAQLVGEVARYEELSAVLRPRPGGDHRRAGGADRLRARAGRPVAGA
jgi:catechol 2,3-dioxygenase-like lactoylglutathione lyase family enzyme